jgi:hypothetical protein
MNNFERAGWQENGLPGDCRRQAMRNDQKAEAVFFSAGQDPGVMYSK